MVLSPEILEEYHRVGEELAAKKKAGAQKKLDEAKAKSDPDEAEAAALTAENVSDTLGVLLKYQDDVEQVRGAGVERILEQVAS